MTDVPDVAVEHDHRPLLQLLGAGHQSQQRRLADPVGSDDPNHESGRNVHRDGVERERAPIAMGNAFDVDHWLGGGSGRGFGSRRRRHESEPQRDV